MEYWVAMNKTELQTALLFLEKMSIPGIIEVGSDVLPEEAVLREMVKKRFFRNSTNGTVWNPFVKTTLWCALNAQSELRINGGSQIVLRLYFYDETMILLVADSDNEQYIFYYVPLLPKAIGGLSKNLERLETIMPARTTNKTQGIPVLLKSSLDSESTVLASSQAIPNQVQNGFFPLTIDGWCLGQHTLESVLIETQKGFWSVTKSDCAIWLTSAGFFDFVESISRWIVRTHGQSIQIYQMKESCNGEVSNTNR